MYTFPLINNPSIHHMLVNLRLLSVLAEINEFLPFYPGSKLKDLAIRMGNQTAVEYIQRQWEDQVGKQVETTANKFPAIECEEAVTNGDIDTLVTPDSWAAGGHHDVVDQFNKLVPH